jgi:hypothetical protein
MIEAFIRGDNGPSRDMLAAGDASLVHSRLSPFRFQPAAPHGASKSSDGAP